MREIKFRAWYANQEMHYGIAPIDNKYYIFFETQKRNAHDLQINRAISIMQYTGLKDKNGKEIYEGDIVKGRHHLGTDIIPLPNGVDEYVEYFSEMIYCVEFENGMFMLSSKKLGKHPFNIPLSELEVIGNIYENPELLEEGE